jgi:hypothetical protein
VSVGADGDAESTGESEIGKLEVAIAVDEKVLRLQVTVKNTVRVAESDSTEHLVQERLHLHRGKASGGLVLVHVLLEVMLKELEHKMQFLLAVNNILQSDDVLVLKLLQQGNFANGCGWNTFIFGVKADFLESNHLLAYAVASLVHNTIRSLSNLFKFRIPVHFSQDQATTLEHYRFLELIQMLCHPPPHTAGSARRAALPSEAQARARARWGEMPFQTVNGMLDKTRKGFCKYVSGEGVTGG